MKVRTIGLTMTATVTAGLMLLTTQATAQESVPANAVPQLSYGVTQVLQLEQAKVGDNAIIGFIKNSGNSYPLDAAQIIYLRQQGVSDAVLAAMLSQPRASVAAATTPTPPPAPAPAPAAAAPPPTPAAAPTTVVQPSVTYVQPAPTTYYYYPPYYYPPYRSYSWPHPVVGVGVGWGWHGGWRVGVAF